MQSYRSLRVASRCPLGSNTVHFAPPLPASSTTIAVTRVSLEDGGVDDVRGALAAQPRFDAVDDQVRLMADDVARRSAEMRRDQHGGQLDVAVFRAHWLVGEDVERGARKVPVAQRRV